MATMVDILERQARLEDKNSGDETENLGAAIDDIFGEWKQVPEQEKKKRKKRPVAGKKEEVAAPAPVLESPAEKSPTTMNLRPPENPPGDSKKRSRRGPKRPKQEPIEFPEFEPQWSLEEINRRHAQMGQGERFYGPIEGLASPGVTSPLKGWQTRATELDTENNPDMLALDVNDLQLREDDSFPIELSLSFNNIDASVSTDDVTFKNMCQKVYSLSRENKGVVGDYTVEYMSVSDKRSLSGRHDKEKTKHKFKKETPRKKSGRGLTYENRRNFLISAFQMPKHAQNGYVMNELDIRRAMRASKIRMFDYEPIVSTIADSAGFDWIRGKDYQVWALRSPYQTRTVTFRATDDSVDESNILMWADFESEMMKQFPGTERDFREFAHNLFVNGQGKIEESTFRWVVQFFASGALRVTIGFREGRQKNMTTRDVERADPRTYVREVAAWFLRTFHGPNMLENPVDTNVAMRGWLKHPTRASLVQGSDGSKRRAVLEQLTAVTKYTSFGISPIAEFDPLDGMKKRVDVVTDALVDAENVYHLLDEQYIEANRNASSPDRTPIPPDVAAQAGQDGYIPAAIALPGRANALRRVVGADGRIALVPRTPESSLSGVSDEETPIETPQTPSTASTVSFDALERQGDRSQFRRTIGTVKDDRGKPTGVVAESGYIKSHVDRWLLSVDPKRDPSGLFDYSALVSTGPRKFKLIGARLKGQVDAAFAGVAETVRQALGTNSNASHDVSVKVRDTDILFVFFSDLEKVAEVAVPREQYPGVFNRPVKFLYWYKTGTLIASASYAHSDEGPWKVLALAWKIVAALFKRSVSQFPSVIDPTKAADPPKKTRKRGHERYGMPAERRGRKKGTTCQPKTRQANPLDAQDWSKNDCSGQNMIVLPNNEGFPCCFEIPKGPMTAAYKRSVQKKYQEIGMDMPDHVLSLLGYDAHPPPLEGVQQKEPFGVGFTPKGEVALGNRQVMRVPIDIVTVAADERGIPTTRADPKKTPYHKKHIAAFFAWNEIVEGRLPTGKTVAFYERVAQYLPKGARYAEPQNKSPETLYAAIEKTTGILKQALVVARMGSGDVQWIEDDNPIPFEAGIDAVTPTPPRRRQPVDEATRIQQLIDDVGTTRGVLNPGNLARMAPEQRKRATEELKAGRAAEKARAKEQREEQRRAQEYQQLLKLSEEEQLKEIMRRERVAQSGTYRRLDSKYGEGTSAMAGGARPDEIEELFDTGTGILEWIE
jgi:hypothetical protein